jgi:hypothetical protein
VSHRAGGGLPLPAFADVITAARDTGVPFAVVLIVLLMLAPRIDHVVQVSDRLDAELQALLSNPPCIPPPKVGEFPTSPP